MNINDLIMTDYEKVEIDDNFRQQIEELYFSESEPLFIDVNTYNKFCSTLNNIVKVRYRDQLKEANTLDENKIIIIKKCVKWAQEIWLESVSKTIKLDRALVAYSIIDYFSLTEEFLNWKVIDIKFIEKIEKSISLITFNIKTHESKNYIEQKSLNDYNDGLQHNDLSKIFSFINQLENGRTFFNFDRFTPNLIIIAYRININSIISLLEKADPLIATYILKIIGADRTISIMSSEHKGNFIFPLIMGIILVIRYFDLSTGELHIPYIELNKMLYQIFTINIFSNPIQSIMKLGNLNCNRIFHSLCGNFLSNYPEYFTMYTDALDFSFEELMCGEEFYNAFIKNCNDQIHLITLSNLITEKYFSFIQENAKTIQINRYTCYLNFIFYAIKQKVFDSHSYVALINEQLYKLLTIQHSWNFEKIQYHYALLYYLIISNVIINIKINDKDISNLINFLKDERYLPLWKNINQQVLINYLTEPENILTIDLNCSNGKKISIKKN